MARTKFTKKIVTPATHRVARVDGRVEADPITPERIKKWAENTNRMIAAGVLIPAPFAHQDTNRKFIEPVILGTDGASLADAYTGGKLPWDSSLNSGFWEKFETDKDGNLVGILEVEGEETDFNTPAGKIAKTIRETSVFAQGSRKVRGRDGQEFDSGEHLAHVAVVIAPKEDVQDNFKPLTAEELKAQPALAMATVFGMADVIAPSTQTTPGSMATPGGTMSTLPNVPPDEELVDLLNLLRADGTELPADTDRENLVERLRLVLTQKLRSEQESEKENESLTNAPAGAQARNQSVAMSTVNTSATPATERDKAFALLMGNVLREKRKTLKERIDALVSSGRCTKEFADKKLYPVAETVVMGEMDADGNFAATAIDTLVEGLESSQPLTGSLEGDSGFGNPPAGSEVQGHVIPFSQDGPDIEDKAADALIDQFLPAAM
jgi:hypothetical protein